jgi:transcriptional regulator with PAS, ATPase and Fis domain
MSCLCEFHAKKVWDMNKGVVLKNEIQLLTNLISATFDIDVGIVGEGLNSLAGTKIYYQKIGLLAPEDSHAANVLQSGESYYIKELSCSKQCLSCRKRIICPFLTGLYQPVIVGDLVKGVIFFLASDNNQREIFLSKCEQLKEYASFTARLMSTIIEKEQAKLHYTDLGPICNSIDEGMIIINTDKIIIFLNTAAQKMLNLKMKESIGQKLDLFFPEILPNKPISHYKPVKISDQKRGLNLIVKPIFINGQLKDYVLLVKTQIGKIKNQEIDVHKNIWAAETQSLDRIIGISQTITKLKTELSKISQNSSTVLLLGETGTGKELCAQFIHELSPRKKGPFVAVNCGAIPNDLLESELFGYEEGAFTGARKAGKAGKFEQANQGTIFLDEIGDLPLSLQVKLLRVLENKNVERLGTCKSKPVNVRVICATNQDLEMKIKRGEFREDLYYRINVVPIYIPPLREHPEDIPLLLDYFLCFYQGTISTPVREFSPELICFLTAYHWPGNIRELKNLVEYICNMENDKTATIISLPAKIKDNLLKFGTPKLIKINPDELERLKIKEALRVLGNTTEGKRQAAHHLGMSLATLYRKLK